VARVMEYHLAYDLYARDFEVVPASSAAGRVRG
jgi:hypothetical protein